VFLFWDLGRQREDLLERAEPTCLLPPRQASTSSAPSHQKHPEENNQNLHTAVESMVYTLMHAVWVHLLGHGLNDPELWKGLARDAMKDR
jgi:hypothetical protein